VGAPARSDPAWSEPRRVAELWAGVLLPPVAWAVHLTSTYALSAFACDPPWSLVFHVLPVAMLAVCFYGGWLGWRLWRLVQDGPENEGGNVGRSRFMAISAVWMSALFALVILAQWFPSFVYEPCRY
jgi:MFS family permease